MNYSSERAFINVYLNTASIYLFLYLSEIRRGLNLRECALINKKKINKKAGHLGEKKAGIKMSMAQLNFVS